MARTGRPTKWTEYEYYRLFEFVIYRRGELKESARCACRHISQREPWRNTGLSAETLRRRFREACRLWDEGRLGRYTPLDLNFALTQDDTEAMMSSFRYRNAMEQYTREA